METELAKAAPKIKRASHVISLRLPAKVLDALNSAAERLETPRNQLIAAALARFLAETKAAKPAKSAKETHDANLFA